VLSFLEACASRGSRFNEAGALAFSRGGSSSSSSALEGGTSADSNDGSSGTLSGLRPSLWEAAAADVLAACAAAAAADGPDVLERALAALAPLAPRAPPPGSGSGSGIGRSSVASRVLQQVPVGAVGLALRRLRLARRADAALPLLHLLRARFLLAAPGPGAAAAAVEAAAASGSLSAVDEVPAWVHMEAVQCYLDSGRPRFAVAWLCSLPRNAPPPPPPAASRNARQDDEKDGGSGVGVRGRPGPRPSPRQDPKQGSAAVGATAEVFANVMRACMKRAGLLEGAAVPNTSGGEALALGGSSRGRPAPAAGVRVAAAADEVPEPVADDEDDVTDDGAGLGEDDVFDVEAAWAVAERSGGVLDEAASDFEAAAGAAAEASELREAVLVLYEEMKLRGVRDRARPR
jgi:hypothetical protein